MKFFQPTAMDIKSLLSLSRPQQWVKNSFIFLPLFFDKKLLEIDLLCQLLLLFLSFSLLASAVYCFNDIFDRKSDRLHPKKQFRPIPSGKVSILEALTLSLVLIISSLCIFLSWVDLFAPPQRNYLLVALTLLFYLILNICYTIYLKHIAVVDVFVIAIGFVLRVTVGAISVDIFLSHWIILMTFLLALFLAFAKRRDDVANYENMGIISRKHITSYNLQFMNQVITVIAAITVVCYIMYTVSPEVIARLGTNKLYLTSVFVLFGLIRYLQITIVNSKSGSPTQVLLHDKLIQWTIIFWISSFITILYV